MKNISYVQQFSAKIIVEFPLEIDYFNTWFITQTSDPNFRLFFLAIWAYLAEVQKQKNLTKLGSLTQSVP